MTNNTDTNPAAFTGFAFDRRTVFKFYDRGMGAGVFIDGRSWDTEREALDYLGTLPFAIQDRIIVLPYTVRELGEWVNGERVA